MNSKDLDTFLLWLYQKKDISLMEEAGCDGDHYGFHSCIPARLIEYDELQILLDEYEREKK